MIVKCLAQEHNTVLRRVLEPRPIWSLSSKGFVDRSKESGKSLIEGAATLNAGFASRSRYLSFPSFAAAPLFAG